MPADSDWESIVATEGIDLNTISWQILKDKSSPKSKLKPTGVSRKPVVKESPKKEIRPLTRLNDDDQNVWRRRFVLVLFQSSIIKCLLNYSDFHHLSFMLAEVIGKCHTGLLSLKIGEVNRDSTVQVLMMFMKHNLKL